MSTRFSFNYYNRDEDGNDLLNLDISFENPESSEDVASKLQTYLNAIGYGNIYVEVQTAKDQKRYHDDNIPF